MTYKNILKTFLRQTAYAGIFLVVLLLVAEYISPGSVTAYFHLYAFLAGLLVALIAAITYSGGDE